MAQRSETISRRSFFVRTGTLALAAPAMALAMSACGSDDEDGGGGGNSGSGCTSSATGSITNRHGHELVIPSADIAAGAAKTYNIQGSSSHSHTVQVSASNMARLQNGESFTTTSSNDSGHDHSVTVSC